MNFPENIEQVLGVDEVKVILRSYCRSIGGHQFVDRMTFSSRIKQVKLWLNQTDQFKQMIDSGKTLPVTDIDFSEAITILGQKHGLLDKQHFVEIRSLCADIQSVLDFFDDSEHYPDLKRLLEEMESPVPLMDKISEVFDEFGDWKRNATLLLSEILDELEGQEKQIYSSVRKVYQLAASNSWTAETDVTVKDGRYVIPIFAEHKRKLRGIMHDESGGGKILYIEPIEVLEATNKLKELELARNREMKRILAELTVFVRDYLSDIKKFAHYMSMLDFIRAKAKFAVDVNGDLVKVSSKSTCEIKKMYHPLLLLSNRDKSKETVPMDLTLTEDERIIVISGPNAGGKSVSIKTLALNQYLLQCGLLPAADPESEFGLYTKILVDIGDNQSIENDLSSYSSHLTAMKYFIKHVNDRSLIVVDELGSGTDPNFGGAMAEAILLELNKHRCKGVVTTHFGNVKSIAKSVEGFANASMAYDTEKLKPLYRFVLGKPGSSFALEVAQNIGLPKRIIQAARKRSNVKQQRTDELLATLELERKEILERLDEVKVKEAHLDQLKDEYFGLKKNLDASKKDMLEDSRKKADAIIREANAEIEHTIKRIKESQADKKATLRARKSLERKRGQLSGKPSEKPIQEVVNIEVGSTVKIPNSNATGEVIQLRKDKAVVLAGIIKSTYPISELKPVKAKKKEKSTVHVGFVNRQQSFAMEKDVRGMRAEEAIKEIETWIDDAVVIGVTNLRLIHGKGNGILKQLVRDYFGSRSYIKRISYEDVRMGGEGVSLIELS